jgi:hypothetical protein
VPEIPFHGDLQIEQDLRHFRRMQVVQRVGWGVMGLIVLAAVLGAFGTGVFSQGAVGAAGDPLRVEYSRGMRYQAVQPLRVRLGPGAGQGGKARVWLSDDYLAGVQVERIDPQPEGVELGPDGQTFTFAVGRLTEPAVVIFYLVPEQVGPLSGRAGLAGGDVLGWSQFVYP